MYSVNAQLSLCSTHLLSLWYHVLHYVCMSIASKIIKVAFSWHGCLPGVRICSNYDIKQQAVAQTMETCRIIKKFMYLDSDI